jgi:hypothetical protein
MCLVCLMLSASTLVARQTRTPRFMILIDEKNMGTYSMGDAEQVLDQYLIAKGVDVVDAELIKTQVNRDRVLQAMTSGPRAAAALGLSFGADVIIVGRAIAKGSADRVQDTSFRSYQATVSLKAVRTDTAEIMTVDSATAAKIHVDDIQGGSRAIRAATSLIAGRMMPRILSRWSLAGNSQPHKIRLMIGNVDQVWQVAAVKKLLRKQIQGVDDVVQRSFVSGVAIFDVYWKGACQQLAEALTVASPRYFRIRVVGVTDGKLDAKLVETGS